jgi:hypothetical protein
MATHEITHGATGNYIEVTCTDADGGTPDFSSGTFQIEVFRKGKRTSVVLDSAPTAVSPAATSGKLRYTFVSGDWDTIPNETEEYHVIWWHTSGGVVTPYPGGGYDTLEVTADPSGTPSDVSEVSYLSTTVAASTYVTLATSQTITGQKTFYTAGDNYVKFDATGNPNIMAAFYRWNPPASPGWQVGAFITDQGAWHSNAELLISGYLDANGIQHPPTSSYMIAAYADVFAPAIVSRVLGGLNDGGSAYAAMARGANPADEHFLWIVDAEGGLNWGDSAINNYTGMDIRLYRAAATQLRTTGSLTVDRYLEVTGTYPSGYVAASGFGIYGSTSPTTGGFRLATTGELQWGQSYDVKLYRSAAATLRVGDSSTGYGHLQVGNLSHNGTTLGFYGATAATKPTITGSRGGNAALADLLTELATLGLITDSTSA